MRIEGWILVGLSLVPGACASTASSSAPVADFRDAGTELFDRDSLNGWRASQEGLWTVAEEAVVAHASRKEHALKHVQTFALPFRLDLSIEPLGRGPSDGKMVQLVDAVGRFASISLDDDVPDTLSIYADGAPGSRGRRMGGLDVAVQIGRAVAFSIYADGRELRVEHGGRTLIAPFEATPPVRIQLAVQRTGARFRGLILHSVERN